MFKVKTNQWFSRDVPALAEILDTEQVYDETDSCRYCGFEYSLPKQSAQNPVNLRYQRCRTSVPISSRKISYLNTFFVWALFHAAYDVGRKY